MSIETIPPEEALRRMRDGALLVDVRAVHERAVHEHKNGHVTLHKTRPLADQQPHLTFDISHSTFDF